MTTLNANMLKAAAAAAFSIIVSASAFAMGGNLATKGEALLKDQCEKCHAVGAEGASKIATVPAFRDTVMGLPGDDLGNSFVAAMSKKHAEFKFEPTDAKAIGDYLDKLRTHLEKTKQ